MKKKAPNFIFWEKENKLVAKNNSDAKKVLSLLTLKETAVVRIGEVPYISILAKIGRYFSTKGRIHKRMEDNHCHENAEKLLFDGKVDNLAIGFALSSDGLWRSHSWGLKKGKIVETTCSFIRYFGFDIYSLNENQMNQGGRK